MESLYKGETWSEQRRFTLRTLRDFGYGESMEDMVAHEVEEVNPDFLWFIVQ